MMKAICAALLTALLFTGCDRPNQNIYPAALQPMSEDTAAAWLNEENLIVTGHGSTARVLGHGSDLPIRELAAGADGEMEYFAEVTADSGALAKAHFEFLSTQGTGRVKLSAIDQNGNVLGVVGYVFTGSIPKEAAAAKWFDLRYDTNYNGGWREENYNFSEVFAAKLPGIDLKKAAKYRVSIVAGEGQHILFDEFSAHIDQNKMVKCTPLVGTYQATLGDIVTILLDVENTSTLPLGEISINLHEPLGYGIVSNDRQQIMLNNLAAGEKRRISFEVKAQRSDAVNLNKPWEVSFTVGAEREAAKVQLSVLDPRPGKVFYCMTEDLEPIDSAGYLTSWGNRDGWLQPDEFIVQLVHKAEKLNEIAQKHGAKWTHYIAWPAVVAGEWADTRSKTGEWAKAVRAVKASVQKEAISGHEYGIHMHTDYDPYLPQNTLSYYAELDGIWANHLRHGWAHSIFEEGDFSERNSRTGSLFEYKKLLDALLADSPLGQSLSARAGSFDFGSGSADEAMSIRASQKVGLWASSDADGNAGGVTAGQFGGEVYFTKPDDINTPASELKNIGIIEVRPTPRDFIMYDKNSAELMNSKVDEGMRYFLRNGQVMPGVHAITGFTHAMFIMGEGDWKSVEGGMFSTLDTHLGYINERYRKSGLIEFGTVSELVKSYLDYYTPELCAVYGKRVNQGWGASEYQIELLGKDIPADREHPRKVSVKYPLYLRDSAYRISILKNGQPIYSTWGIPTPFNDVSFMVDDKSAVYTMKIYHNSTMYKIMNKVKMVIKYSRGK